MVKKKQNSTKKSSKKTLSLLLASALFAGGVVIGDYARPITRANQALFFYHRSFSDSTPRDGYNADIKYEVTKNNRINVYFGNESTGEYRLVNPDYTVGRCPSKHKTLPFLFQQGKARIDSLSKKASPLLEDFYVQSEDKLYNLLDK